MIEEEKKRIKRWLFDQAWVAIAMAVITLMLGVLISELQNTIGWKSLLVAIGFVAIVFGFVTWMVFRYVYDVSTGLAEELKHDINCYVDPNKLSWVFTNEQLISFEKAKKWPEIWLVSSDLAFETQDGIFHKVVSANLKKGVIYRYFVSNDLTTKARIEQIFSQHNNHPGLSVTPLEDDFFFLVPRFDFAIYNPKNVGRIRREAYMGIPISDEPVMYHAKISDDLIDVLMGKLLSQK
jgi:hypothetical protein